MLSKEWRKAREAKGLTQEEVMDLWKASGLPTAIIKNMGSGQYKRLDAADPAKPEPQLWPITKYELACLLDIELRDADSEAADAFDATVSAVSTRATTSLTWETPSPGDTTADATAVAA